MSARPVDLGVGHHSRSRAASRTGWRPRRTRCTRSSATRRSRPRRARTAASWSWRATGAFPRLVELGDIRGDLHSHTTASDGHGSIAEMAAAAMERGYEYLAMTDHSHGVGMGIGLEPERVPRARRADPRARGHAARHVPPAGRRRGRRDDATRRSATRTTCWRRSTGSSRRCTMSQRIDRDRMTARLLAAATSPHVDVVGHPSGRQLGDARAVRLRPRGRDRGLRRARHVPRDQREPAPARPGAAGGAARDRGGRRPARDHRRAPHDDARLHALRRGDGAAGVGDAGRS